MHVLLVLAHPVPESFNASVAATARAALEENGHTVDLLDLYREGFCPRLSESERRGYFDIPYDSPDVAGEIARLKAADALVLVFPQWGFNFPAILKGFFDRVLAPGVGFVHDLDGGRIRPGLTRLRHVRVLTTTGSPWWIVRLYMGNPVHRLLKRGVVKACTAKADFRMVSLHDMDRRKPHHLKAHLEKVRSLLGALK